MESNKGLIFLLLLLIIGAGKNLQAQESSLSGEVMERTSGIALKGVEVKINGRTDKLFTDSDGKFYFSGLNPSDIELWVFMPGFSIHRQYVSLKAGDNKLIIYLDSLTFDLKGVDVTGESNETIGIDRLKPVEGSGIYAGRKTEVIVLEKVNANLATNNARELYSRVTGLNIWESDGGGLQLGIGGRGLNPNRVSNFNTRQNGYDISADALGYPESYYTPPAEALERIEIVRGAASLQYGTQFGGILNFKLKSPSSKKLEIISRQTAGSWNFFNSFNSLSGTSGKFSYYGFLQHKQGDGWRPNSSYSNNTGYLQLGFKPSSKLKLTAEYTGMNYLAQQAGGLTDRQFEVDPRQSNRHRNWFDVNWNLFALSADVVFTPMLTLNNRAFYLSASRKALGFLGTINRPDPLTNRDLLVDHYQNYGNETRLIWRYPMKRRLNVWLAGVRLYKGHTERNQGWGNAAYGPDFDYNDPEQPGLSQYIFPSYNIAFFSEHIFQMNDRFTITPGLRYEIIHTGSEGYYHEEYRDLAGNVLLSRRVEDNRENSRGFLLAGLGLSYKFRNDHEFYSNFSQNYRSISFNDMRIVNPNLKVNPDLRDETGYTLDAGFRGKIREIFTYEATAFLLKYDDRIGTILRTDSSTWNVYRYRTNISDSRNTGIECMAEFDLAKWKKPKGKTSLTIFSNFSVIDARYINSQELAIDGNKVEFVPELILKSGLTWRYKNWKAAAQWSYTSIQFTDATNAVYTANAVSGTIPAYQVGDFSAGYTKKWFCLSGGINNIANTKYFTRRADGYPGPGIIPSDGRSFYISLQFKFGIDNKKAY